MNSDSPAAEQIPAASAQQPSILHANESLSGAPLRMIGNVLWTKLATTDGHGSLSVLQNTISAHNGPPLHVHPFEEFFYILEGSFVFEIGDDSFAADPGDFLHVPGNIPHVFQNTTEREAKLLLIARPGGVEKYFSEVAAQAIHDPGNIAALHAVGERYCIRIIGPSIAARQRQA